MLYITAGLVALGVIMIAAWVVPRFLEEAPLLRWLVTLGAGMLTFAAIVGFAWLRRAPGAT